MPEEQLHQLRREYDEYIANLDAEFGIFYQSLLDAGILENSYVIVTSDHGQLFERGVHGHVTPLLYDPVIHIPLIISAPGQAVRRDVYTPTSCVDVLPTVLKLTGSSHPELQESSPLPGFAADAIERPVFAVESKKSASFLPLTKGTFAMMHGDYKLIWYRGYSGHDDTYELFNIKTDPEELTDLSCSKPDTTYQMAEQLRQKLAESEEY
jgi:arylsulfatase A-like enzyme